jgi:hypothetical protein
MVLLKAFRPMCTWQKPQTTVFSGRIIKSNPNGTGGQRPNGPIFSILMPRSFTPYFCWLGKKTRIPESYIWTYQLLDHVENVVIPRKIQKTGIVNE